jgi:4-amino-4-deoxy-L-arabinose transferase-like glycosyltransferase
MTALNAIGTTLLKAKSLVRTGIVLVLLTSFAVAIRFWAGNWSPLLPRDVLNVSVAGALASLAAFLAAQAIGVRARTSGIARPPGFPTDPCGETARFINAYNVLKEAAANPIDTQDASSFAVDLYLKAMGRKPNVNAVAKPAEPKREP